MLRSSRSLYGRVLGSLSALSFHGKSMTRQSDAKGTDINLIVKRFKEHGVAPPMPPVPPKFGDFTRAPDFETLMGRIVQARESFEGLPLALRKRFVTMENFVAFCDDPANLDEMRKLKLAVPAPVPVPEKVTKVEVVNAKSKRKSGGKDDVEGGDAD